MTSRLRPLASTGLTAALAAGLVLGAAVPAAAQLVRPEPPVAREAADLAAVPRLVLPPVDVVAAIRADEERGRRAQAAHYAVALPVGADPWRHGAWDVAAAGTGEPGRARWRLRIASPGARSLNLAFDRFRLPAGARLVVAAADGSARLGPYGPDDADAHGQLWTPPLETSDLVVEVELPFDRLEKLELRLAGVQHGYAGFGDPAPRSGPCHVDVACPEAEPWREVARSVALLSIAGVRFCTGFLVDNTAHDRRPLLMTAHHCGVTPENAASVVAIWAQESATCRSGRRTATPPAPRLAQTGATYLAGAAATDFALLELDDPPPAEARVFWAGWNRAPGAPAGVAVVHHPNTDFKSFALDRAATRVTPAFRDDPVGRGGHLRVGGWSLGSTEGGSSGAPLFDAERRVVGQLRGGHAACDVPLPDWFGRLADAWAAGPDPAHRLREWLDPLATGATVVDGVGPPATQAAR